METLKFYDATRADNPKPITSVSAWLQRNIGAGGDRECVAVATRSFAQEKELYPYSHFEIRISKSKDSVRFNIGVGKRTVNTLSVIKNKNGSRVYRFSDITVTRSEFIALAKSAKRGFVEKVKYGKLSPAEQRSSLSSLFDLVNGDIGLLTRIPFYCAAGKSQLGQMVCYPRGSIEVALWRSRVAVGYHIIDRKIPAHLLYETVEVPERQNLISFSDPNVVKWVIENKIMWTPVGKQAAISDEDYTLMKVCL